jgi:hypothetical protein
LRRILTAGLVLVVNCFVISTPGFAHHGTAEYDNSKTISLHGTVTAFKYLNPHVLIDFTVKGENDQVAEWTAESQSPNLLSRRGWSRSTLKPGDEVVLTGHPVKNGAHALTVQKVVFADGRETPNLGLPPDSPK